eukprot:4885950-Pyramimonas_sp.AAC.1
MFRAATTSSAFHQAAKRMSEFALSDECQITRAWNEWWKNSIAISTWQNYDFMNQIPRGPVCGDRRFQHKAERALLRRRKYYPHQFLFDRQPRNVQGRCRPGVSFHAPCSRCCPLLPCLILP